ncbi:MAG: NAD-dependent deacylase [Candidatus Marinimicrobia bacterium]|nr:NAD-dependent deacylase [Candidatus Neomarinimicrobiota bacterium]
MTIQSLEPDKYNSIVLFTGAGMSAESGVPTYRGAGGIWSRYNWEEVACETAFRADPAGVLEFHDHRRKLLEPCRPHAGHAVIAGLEKRHPSVAVITQNIDGLHQQAGSERVIELHGSLWRVRCTDEGRIIDLQRDGEWPRKCDCGAWLRPDITWFGDQLNHAVMRQADEIIRGCDLFIAVGTSGVVWPAAGFPQLAKSGGALCVEINTEDNEMSGLYDTRLRGPAGEVLPELLK